MHPVCDIDMHRAGLDTYRMSANPAIQQLYDTPESELLAEIERLRAKLGERVLILGHHYQREEVIGFADVTGDSLKLAQLAAQTDAPYIIFCGVHFMAETADILTSDSQTVILPDLAAGCSMADMADAAQVRHCWQELAEIMQPDTSVTPVTYINSTAALKSFCGEHGGVVCTSSNCEKVLNWAWGQREKVLFFPDQHLGENTALAMGVPETDMIIWDPAKPLGGNSVAAIQQARMILWKGFCSVHQLFKPQHSDAMRENHPGIEILAHPECSRAVCESADFVGSTEAIIQYVQKADAGQAFAIATELNLVNRLRLQHPDNPIYFLSPTVCMCSTMFRTDPPHLLAALQEVEAGKVAHPIRVPAEDQRWGKLSLERMLNLA